MGTKNARVCIIRSNPVKPDSRVEKEAWALKKAGYDVHILAWDRDAGRRETEDFVTVSEVEIPITRLGHKASFGEGFKNIKPYIEFQFHMREWLKKHTFDIIHACDFDTAFFSYGIAKRKKERFVFDIFDFLFDKPTSFMQKCVKRAQYMLINKADATIICTEERKNQIVGSAPKNLTVIHNTPAAAQAEKAAADTIPSDRVKIVYVGILQDYRLLKEVVEAVSQSEMIEIHIGGFGKYEDYLREMAKTSDNIYFYGRTTYADTLAIEKACDIMLAIYDPTIDNHFYAAPNKFYESLMLGKPVVMVRGTGMSQVVEENNIGVLIEYSKEGFIKGIAQLIEKKPQWEAMGERMQKLYKKQYSWAEMEKRLLTLYQELTI